jgi:hypothetical protein
MVHGHYTEILETTLDLCGAGWLKKIEYSTGVDYLTGTLTFNLLDVINT